MQNRILVVADDRHTIDTLRMVVAQLDCEMILMRSVGDGIKAAGLADFRVIVLDRDLPGNGDDDVSRLRSGAVCARILLLSALRRIETKEQAGDDHLCKPVEPTVMLSKLRLLLDQGLAAEGDVLAFGDLEVRLKARIVQVNRINVPVSPKEFELISYFARNAGRVLTRMQLLQNVWHLNFDPGTNLVDVHVGRLRRKLEEAGAQAIQTARGEGYIFAPIARRPRDAAG